MGEARIMIFPVLSVHDVDAALNFYVNKLGFKQDMVMPGPDGKNFFGSASLGGAGLGFLLDPVGEPRGVGVELMLYPTDTDLDAHYAAVTANGVTITDPISDKYWGDRAFTVRDLNGYTITIAKVVKQMTMEEIASARAV
jgi:uncharacterized glyoxalase superfamily protein PhnB